MTIRVLVVDDSSFFRRQIQKLLLEDPGLEVVGTASDGKEAIEKVRALKPDIVTMDIEMPIMDGIASTREIMRRHPVPILIFSSLATEGAQATFDALEAGAVDFIPKRFEDISKKRDEVQKLLCTKITNIAKHGIITRRVKPIHKPIIVGHKAPIKTLSTVTGGKYKLLAIGTSTGGPVALQDVLSKLPKDFPVPILMVQHMPASFTPAFANRLDQTCDIHVKEAEKGDVLCAGTAYLAPGGKQMTVRGSSIDITDSDPSLTYKPSVDLTFSSLADVFKDKVLAIVLTGMGADGCEGAKKLKSAGSTIWAQDEASCVVYGMPAAVVNAGITEKILPIKDVALNIIKHVS